MANGDWNVSAMRNWRERISKEKKARDSWSALYGESFSVKEDPFKAGYGQRLVLASDLNYDDERQKEVTLATLTTKKALNAKAVEEDDQLLREEEELMRQTLRSSMPLRGSTSLPKAHSPSPSCRPYSSASSSACCSYRSSLSRRSCSPCSSRCSCSSEMQAGEGINVARRRDVNELSLRAFHAPQLPCQLLYLNGMQNHRNSRLPIGAKNAFSQVMYDTEYRRSTKDGLRG
mmetsp:Transcript_10421/g.17035  ORF Transcript_10421/g.17035 Transcript_10421/m.17035 type:complete len:232 (+) Transcript_10421:101-796(+)